MNSTPLPEGRTSYCNKSFHLANHFGNGLGLPPGEKSPATIYDTFPDMYEQGAPLPRPYGPVDNLRMGSLFNIRGFGGKRKMRKMHNRHRRPRRRFGSTPGTPAWNTKSVSSSNSIPLYIDVGAKSYPNVIGGTNLPAQFTNNQLNLLNFGKKRRRSVHKESVPRRKPMLSMKKATSRKMTTRKMVTRKMTKVSRPTRKSTTKMEGKMEGKMASKPTKKSRRRFGLRSLVPTVSGPNTAGYRSPIPVYHSGANTINFMNNKSYFPDIIGQVGKVQGDGTTPSSWLSQSVGIGDGLGTKNRFGKKKSFGKLAYNLPIESTGRNVIAQPLPPYMKKSFGERVISLEPSGRITIK